MLQIQGLLRKPSLPTCARALGCIFFTQGRSLSHLAPPHSSTGAFGQEASHTWFSEWFQKGKKRAGWSTMEIGPQRHQKSITINHWDKNDKEHKANMGSWSALAWDRSHLQRATFAFLISQLQRHGPGLWGAGSVGGRRRGSEARAFWSLRTCEPSGQPISACKVLANRKPLQTGALERNQEVLHFLFRGSLATGRRDTIIK